MVSSNVFLKNMARICFGRYNNSTNACKSFGTKANFALNSSKEGTVIKNSDHFEIRTRNGISVQATFAWLRDHCRSHLMYNSRAEQRMSDIRTIREAAVPASHSFNDQGLEIKWVDGHVSNFSWSFLDETCLNKRRFKMWGSSGIEPIPWDASSVPSFDQVTVPYNELMASIEKLRTAYKTIMKHGFLLVEGVPTEIKDGILKVVKRLGKPCNVGINYETDDGLWVLTSKEGDDLSDMGHTNASLQPHADGSFLLSAPGLLAFHCLKEADKGGETSLIDGFKAAENLRRNNPEAYRYLSVTPVEFQYLHSHSDKKEHFYNVDCLIKHHPDNPEKIMQVKFNNCDRASLSMSLEDQREFYKHYPEFAKELLDEKNCLWFKQTPGTMVIVDNWRLLHGRTSFQGERIMAGYYIGQDDVLSRLTTLGL